MTFRASAQKLAFLFMLCYLEEIIKAIQMP